MRPLRLLAAILVPLIALPVGAPSPARAQEGSAMDWRTMGVTRCPRADTLYGRQYRSHASIIRVAYSPQADSTGIRTPHRNLSWQAGSSRLKVTQGTVWLPGHLRIADSARIELLLGFVDSVYRSPEQATLTFDLDDTLHFEILNPRIDYVVGVQSRGVPLLVTALLSPDQSLALSRARNVKGTMGPYPFLLFDWELWELNAIYRGSFCGVE